jgi:hypothetical protein
MKNMIFPAKTSPEPPEKPVPWKSTMNEAPGVVCVCVSVIVWRERDCLTGAAQMERAEAESLDRKLSDETAQCVGSEAGRTEEDQCGDQENQERRSDMYSRSHL